MYDTKSVQPASMVIILHVRCKWRAIQMTIYTKCDNSKPFKLELMKYPTQ